jgi:hypothetical protein
MGVGVLKPFRPIPSLADILPSMGKRLAVLSVLFYAAASLLTVITVVRSNLRW